MPTGKTSAVQNDLGTSDSPYRTAISGAILKLQEEGKLHLLKTRWWKEKRGGGSCRVSIEHANTIRVSLIFHKDESAVDNCTLENSDLPRKCISFWFPFYNVSRKYTRALEGIDRPYREKTFS